MSYRPHIVYIPGATSIDIVESVQMAVEKIRPYRRPFKIRSDNLATSRNKFIELVPAAKRILTSVKVPAQKARKSIKAVSIETSEDKAKRVRRELLDAGITFYGLMKSETRALPKVLHPNEHVETIVYGQHHANSVMLVATDERIIYLDKKPMALYLDEVSYEVVSGIEFEIHLFYATLILHTPVKNYDIRYANLRCAEKFARHIEAHRLMREQPEKEPEIEAEFSDRHPAEPIEALPHKPKEDMAGYYLLPTEEEEERPE